MFCCSLWGRASTQSLSSLAATAPAALHAAQDRLLSSARVPFACGTPLSEGTFCPKSLLLRRVPFKTFIAATCADENTWDLENKEASPKDPIHMFLRYEI